MFRCARHPPAKIIGPNDDHPTMVINSVIVPQRVVEKGKEVKSEVTVHRHSSPGVISSLCHSPWVIGSTAAPWSIEEERTLCDLL